MQCGASFFFDSYQSRQLQIIFVCAKMTLKYTYHEENQTIKNVGVL